jgi:hypothetical protein
MVLDVRHVIKQSVLYAQQISFWLLMDYHVYAMAVNIYQLHQHVNFALLRMVLIVIVVQALFVVLVKSDTKWQLINQLVYVIKAFEF